MKAVKRAPQPPAPIKAPISVSWYSDDDTFVVLGVTRGLALAGPLVRSAHAAVHYDPTPAADPHEHAHARHCRIARHMAELGLGTEAGPAPVRARDGAPLSDAERARRAQVAAEASLRRVQAPHLMAAGRVAARERGSAA